MYIAECIDFTHFSGPSMLVPPVFHTAILIHFQAATQTKLDPTNCPPFGQQNLVNFQIVSAARDTRRVSLLKSHPHGNRPIDHYELPMAKFPSDCVLQALPISKLTAVQRPEHDWRSLQAWKMNTDLTGILLLPQLLTCDLQADPHLY